MEMCKKLSKITHYNISGVRLLIICSNSQLFTPMLQNLGETWQQLAKQRTSCRHRFRFWASSGSLA